MRFFLSFGCLLFLAGCANSISTDSLPLLNGYWEIEKVVFPDGNSKEYKASTTVDFIALKNQEGYRKKVQPKFDGTFDTSNDAEPFLITDNDGRFYFQYKNDLSEWKELLVEISDDSFAVVNEDGIRYEYKRFVPLTIEN